MRDVGHAVLHGGRTDVSITSGGSVDSIWLKNAVQENVR